MVCSMSALQFDAQSALAAIRRMVASAPAEFADGLASVVRGAPDERLEQLMRTPARRAILDGIFWQMPRHFDGNRAAGMRSSIRWRITGRPDGRADTYDLEIADGRCRAIREPTGTEPNVTITVAGAEFLRLATGSSDPMRAYFKGRIALSGNIMAAAKLVSLFRIPTSRTAGGGSRGKAAA
jgi:putative sterol carrier protein